MKVISSTGKSDVATVYIAEFGDGDYVEFVESVQPPIPREQKWVLIISTMYGCPVGCLMCDAGDYYRGKLTAEQMLAQIDYPVRLRYPDKVIPAKNFKIQFARMGDPALNDAVLDVLSKLPEIYDAPGLIPSISTIAPGNCDVFFDRLLEIKNELYANGNFQFQFSLHSTDEDTRNRISPVSKWQLADMATYGDKFFSAGDRKITLNFALAKDTPLDPAVLLRHFDPALFIIKITPINPTYNAAANDITSYIDPHQNDEKYEVIDELRDNGYDVILSIGEVRENGIGSNCGQYIKKHLSEKPNLSDGYLSESVLIEK